MTRVRLGPPGPVRPVGPFDSRRTRLLALAAALLAMAWVLGPAGRTPPLYDGLGFPDQPYRYVSVPAGYSQGQGPSTASATVEVSSGDSSTYDVSSSELGPQVEVFVNAKDLHLPPGSTLAHVRATPVATATQPSDGEVWGNVYRLSVSTDTGPGTIRAGGALDSIRMRAPTGPPPVAGIEFDNGSGWRRLTASKIGNDIYSAPLAGVGEYAVVSPEGQAKVPNDTSTGSSAASGSTSPGSSQAPIGSDTKDASGPSSAYARPLLVIVALALLVLVVVIGMIRFARHRGPPAT